MEEYLIFEIFSADDKIDYEKCFYEKYQQPEKAIEFAKLMYDTEEENKIKHGNYIVYKFINRHPDQIIFDASKGNTKAKTIDFKPTLIKEDIELIDRLILMCVDNYEIDLCYKLQNFKRRIDYFINET